MSAKKPKRRSNSPSRRFHKVVKARRQTYPWHKRILLHPLGAFFVLCVGVFMVGWTYKVIADTAIISSVIEAPPLQTAATIDSPANNSRFASSPITVSGTCPSDSYVQLTVNGTFSGVAWCESNNSYSIVTSLYPGVNNLIVQAYNKTDRPGPSADGIQVIYTPPTPLPPATGSGENTGTDITPPLLLSSSFNFQTFTDGQTFKWSIGITGGEAPYNLYADWGDSLNSKVVVAAAGPVTIQHTYRQPGYYPVLVKVVDAQSFTKVIQLAALITDTHGHATFLGNNSSGSGTNGTPGSHLSSSVKWLLLALPSYLIVMLMTMSFWLGERREYLLLKPHKHRHA